MQAKHLQGKFLLFAGLTGYLIANGLLRWYHFKIFDGHGPFGWPQPSLFEIVLLCNSVIVAALGFALLVYALAWLLNRVVAERWVVRFVVLAFFLALAGIELDLAWYSMSKQHATLADVEVLLTEDWGMHLGLTSADVFKNVTLVALHLFFVVAIAGLSGLLQRRLPLGWLPAKPVAYAAILIVGLDVSAALFYVDRENEQWRTVNQMNPLAVGVVEGVIYPWTQQKADLDQVNRDFRALAPADVTDVSSRTKVQPNDMDVLIVVVEGFNPNLFDAESMPTLNRFAQSSVSSERHYSTGNITAYGLLGLMFGKPLDFYYGKESARASVSSYIDSLNSAGYNTNLFGDPIHDYRHMGHYLENFNGEVYESTDHWDLLPRIKQQLASPGKQFVLTYYYGTHYSFHHGEKWQKFQPEVPDDFNYTTTDLYQHREEIKNRYRNCLLEADEWLESLFADIDLSNTVVVVTGDHGEEFFENGRLSHAATLEEPQVRTPLLVRVPGRPAERLASVTSHLQIMPTVFDAIGLPTPEDALTKSVLDESAAPFAVITANNGRRLPNEWAVVTADHKLTYRWSDVGELAVVGLFDANDVRLATLEDHDLTENLRIGRLLEARLQSARQPVVATADLKLAASAR